AAFRDAEGPLAPTTQVLDHATLHVVTDLSERPSRIAQAEVVHPAFQVPVNLGDELRNGLPALACGGHRRQFRHFPLPRLARPAPVQITTAPTKAVAVVPELVSQKI